MCEGKYKGQRCTKEMFEEERREHPEHLTVCYVMKEEDVDLALNTLNVMLGSDGIMNNGQGHPRSAGSFTRLFSEFVRKGMLSLLNLIILLSLLSTTSLHHHRFLGRLLSGLTQIYTTGPNRSRNN